MTSEPVPPYSVSQFNASTLCLLRGHHANELPLTLPLSPLWPPSLPDSEPCGGVLDASDAGYITTPGYPLEYPPHQSCRWVITAPEPSQRIVLNFNPHFEIEKLDCR